MLQKARQLLFAASPKITDVGEREKAELLASLLLFRLAMVYPVLHFLWVYKLWAALKIALPMIVTNAVAYFVSRSQKYKTGAVLWALEILIGLTFIGVIMSDRIETAVAPMWLGVAVLASSLFLSARTTLYYFFAVLISCAIFAVTVEPNRLALTHGTILFVIIYSGLIVISAYQKEKIDKLLEREKAKVIEISKLSSLGEMAGGVAHEINSPLNAVMMSAEIVASQLDNEHEAHKSLRTIMLSGEKISSIIKGLRAFSRDSNVEVKSFTPAHSLVNLTLGLCRSKFELHRIRIDYNEENFAPQVCGIGSQYSQVMLNVMMNSFDALRLVEEKWIKIESKIENDYLVVSITDSGAGISDKIADKIFQPFFTTKEVGSGAGLGLSIAKGLMQQNGGDLIYDRTSKNTRFLIRIPTVSPELIHHSYSAGPV